MSRYFFTATESAHEQITDLFDFVWSTAAAMWNLRWQVNGYLQIIPNATVEQLRARFTEGGDISGVNLRRTCVEHTWDQQKESFARIILVNSIASFEGWIDEVLEELARNTKTLNTALQFPDSTATAGKGAAWAIGELSTLESSELKTAFYPPLSRGRHFALAKLDAMLLCYRFFKELRNCSMHGGGIANQRLIDAYNRFSSVATTTSLGVSEVPAHVVPTIDTPTLSSLRGVVGFTGILFKIIATLDAELSRSKLSEKPFVSKWKVGNPHTKTLSSIQTKRVFQIKKMADNARFPRPANVHELGNLLNQFGLCQF